MGTETDRDALLYEKCGDVWNPVARVTIGDREGESDVHSESVENGNT